MLLSEQFYQTEKTGYLNEQFRLFHLKDQTRKEFSYHYHDFHKVVIFISGKAAYHIEGKAYQLKPWDILLVNRHAIHRPEIDPSVPYERFIPDTVTFSSVYGLSEPYLSGKAVHF